MVLTVQNTKKETVLEIDLNSDIQNDITRLQHDLANGHIDSKQYTLKILSTIIRSKAK